MQEKAVRDVLQAAASGASMPERFLLPSRVIGSARPRFGWQRFVLAATAMAMACALTVMVVPQARALAVQLAKGISMQWHGRLNGHDAEIIQADNLTALKKEIPSYATIPIDPPRLYQSLDEVVAAVGFRPIETHYPDAKLAGISVQSGGVSPEKRFVTASTNYKIGQEAVSVTTAAVMSNAEGHWQVVPPGPMSIINDGQGPQMTNVRTIKLGDTEAVALDIDTPSGKETMISWPQDDVVLHVSGFNAELVERVAAATVKQ